MPATTRSSRKRSINDSKSTDTNNNPNYEPSSKKRKLNRALEAKKQKTKYDLKIGDDAPIFNSLPCVNSDQNEYKISLKDLISNNDYNVIYFYPRDNTKKKKKSKNSKFLQISYSNFQDS